MEVQEELLQYPGVGIGVVGSGSIGVNKNVKVLCQGFMSRFLRPYIF